MAVSAQKAKKACIIRSIDASEANENSRVVPGYGEMRSEANLAVRFTKSEAKTKPGESMLYFTPCSTKPDSKHVQTAVF